MAAKACKAAYQNKLAVRSFFRSQPANQAAKTGAPIQVKSADVEINCPVVATETSSEVLISARVPMAIMTPVPITTLPNIKGHRTRGNGLFIDQSMWVFVPLSGTRY